MIPVEIACALPAGDGTPGEQAAACLALLGVPHDRILSLTFFSDATEAGEHRRRREEIAGVVGRLAGPGVLPVSLVAQAPEGGRSIALEAVVLDRSVELGSPAVGVTVHRRSCEGIPYTLVEGPGVRQLHAVGIFADGERDGAGERAGEAIARAEAVLAAERMDFGHVVRKWNYLEGMLRVRDGICQGYQAFNDARSIAYGKCGFPHGYPASTGIGQATGGVLIEFIAVDSTSGVEIAPISNPRQIDAHRYSEAVLVGEPLEGVDGKTMPKFERAKLVARDGERVVYVSGTASIIGEESVGPGDVAVQTRTTLENISMLIGGAPLTSLRAYVKRSEDIPVVRRVCEEAHGDIPALFVVADVCRDELLVEIEGMLIGRESVRAAGESR